MTKKKDNTSPILRDVCDRAFKTIATAQQELTKLELTPEEMTISDHSNVRVNTARYMLSMMTVLSDVISPAFEFSKKNSDGNNTKFIQQVQERYNLVLEQNAIAKLNAKMVAKEAEVMLEGEQK